jgi:ketosteroid isomerase-like protein
MNPRFAAVFLSAAALLAGCAKTATENYKAELIAADKAFSAASAKDGPKAAFLAAVVYDTKLLGDRLAGPDAVRDMFRKLPPTASLTWDPAFVDVSASGDLGYTWGRYMLIVPSSKAGAPPYTKVGTYATVWKRQPNGKWKVVLDGDKP